MSGRRQSLTETVQIEVPPKRPATPGTPSPASLPNAEPDPPTTIVCRSGTSCGTARDS